MYESRTNTIRFSANGAKIFLKSLVKVGLFVIGLLYIN